MKAALGRGHFLTWIEAELGMTIRTAHRIMAVTETFGHENDTVSHLPAGALYELAAPSTPPEVRETVVERAAASGKLTVTVWLELRHEIAGLCDIMNVWAE